MIGNYMLIRSSIEKPKTVMATKSENPNKQTSIDPLGMLENYRREISRLTQAVAAIEGPPSIAQTQAKPPTSILESKLRLQHEIEARLEYQQKVTAQLMRMRSEAAAIPVDGMTIPNRTPKAHNPDMTDITRDELDAKLENNRSGLRADFAEFRADMATSRREQSEQTALLFGGLTAGMGELRNSVASLSGRVDGLSGRLDGLTTSMGMLQWVIGSAVAVIGLIFAVGGAWIGYQQLELAKVPAQATTVSAPTPKPAAAVVPAPTAATPTVK